MNFPKFNRSFLVFPVVCCAIMALGLGVRTTSAADQKAADKITWLTNYDEAVKKAGAEKKPIVVDFYATWCGPCKQMEKSTFTDKNVISKVQNFVALKVDIDQQEALAKRYNIKAVPTTILLGADQKVIAQEVGMLAPAQFISLLDKAPKKTS